MKKASRVETKLQKCEPEIQAYVTALKKENLKLQARIIEFEVHDVSLNNRIKILAANQREGVDLPALAAKLVKNIAK